MLLVLLVILQVLIGQDGAITITAGGAGTTATGQFVSEVTVID